jgi:hypothetical protein
MHGRMQDAPAWECDSGRTDAVIKHQVHVDQPLTSTLVVQVRFKWAVHIKRHICFLPPVFTNGTCIKLPSCYLMVCCAAV